MQQDQLATAPWYKQPWLWFILAPVIASVISGGTFLYFSIVSADGIVKDDYYKVARGFNLNTEPLENAQRLGLSGDLLIDDVTGDIALTLAGALPADLEQLELEVVHPTHQQYDQLITLRRLAGSDRFSGNLQKPLHQGKRYLLLRPAGHEWNLRAEALPPYDPLTIRLVPQL
ncbi:membrane protein [Marinobacterium nitratireducens]|uniref:Membrane protein n=1 Tax=Marinobacterium nitratireducens TaxID=518897 RepID=A0A917Z5D2_9GAMM|nr:FixH family protein [Marinobacterium nitratireducens]GGO75787.1 membrane protein [Marinobacterium nitratireducens]